MFIEGKFDLLKVNGFSLNFSGQVHDIKKTIRELCNFLFALH